MRLAIRATVRSALLLTWGLATLLGCGDSRPTRAPISGRVLIDGQPVTCGTICIIPDNARMAAGEIGPDGRFTMNCFGANDELTINLTWAGGKPFVERLVAGQWR